jgi:hypothetical protein
LILKHLQKVLRIHFNAARDSFIDFGISADGGFMRLPAMLNQTPGSCKLPSVKNVFGESPKPMNVATCFTTGSQE